MMMTLMTNHHVKHVEDLAKYVEDEYVVK